MRPSKATPVVSLCLCGLALACGPKPGPAAEPADPGPPVAGEPVGETPTPANESPPSKCFADGGTCVAPSATLACKRFEEGDAWGCTDEGTGCCFQ